MPVSPWRPSTVMFRSGARQGIRSRYRSGRDITLHDHQAFLSEVFSSARTRIIVVSPFVTKAALNSDRIPAMIQAAVGRGVSVSVYTDSLLNHDQSGDIKRTAAAGILLLQHAGAHVYIVQGIHNKTLIKDNDLIADGSFNWFSAVRDRGAVHQREERTMITEGKQAEQMIEEEVKRFEASGIKQTPPAPFPDNKKKNRPKSTRKTDTSMDAHHASISAPAICGIAAIIAVIGLAANFLAGDQKNVLSEQVWIGLLIIIGIAVAIFACYFLSALFLSRKEIFTAEKVKEVKRDSCEQVNDLVSIMPSFANPLVSADEGWPCRKKRK